MRLRIDGQDRDLKLTLGALAELEAGLHAGTLVELIERFETGRFGAREVVAILIAGLRGGGWRGNAEEIARADIDGGPIEAARVAALLLARAFSLPQGEAGGGS